MQWCQDFESGLPEIDGQHQRIFALIQRVHEVDERNDRAGILEVLVELERFTLSHFDSEERLMVEYQYLDAAKHTAEHATLLRELQSYRGNAVFSARQLYAVLCNWLMSHSMMADRPLALHVMRLRARAREGAAVARDEEPALPSAICSIPGELDKLASDQ